MVSRARLLDRFLRYVRIDTTANDATDTYPSSGGQLELGKMLIGELKVAGIADALQDEFGLVYATIPATLKTDLAAIPVIAFNAHLDTSPETTGANVAPQVIENYAGGDIPLPSREARVIRVADSPELLQLVGKTIITTRGDTLLGADDKAGVAAIMELAVHLMEHPEIPHGPIRILFTCDEEIGRGVQHVNFRQLGAIAAYTLDGQGSGDIDVETFSADLASIVFSGRNIHPSIGKGRMINALRAAAEWVSLLPQKTLAPEVTSEREGFLHPYQIAGGVADVRLKVLLRDFETAALAEQGALLRNAAKEVEAKYPGCRVEVEIRPQYRNMREGLLREPRAVAFAQQAMRKAGVEPKLTLVRGGTDGSQLTAHGLPTPNLSTGEHNPHSPLEFCCLEEMETAVRVMIELVKLWSAPTASAAI